MSQGAVQPELGGCPVWASATPVSTGIEQTVRSVVGCSQALDAPQP